MRRRRRARATWLPVNPTFFGEETSGQTWFDFFDVLPTGSQEGDWVGRAIPITLDETPDLGNAPEVNSRVNSLRDWVEGQEYILDRVVGKVNVGLYQTLNTSVIDGIACFAIAVLPTEPGTDTPAIPPQEWMPLYSANIMQPWLVRRTWHLRNGVNGGAELAVFPTSNTSTPGTFEDGPCIDTNVKRRIRKEQRLFAIFAFVNANSKTGAGPDQVIRWSYDLRVLGHMVKARNRSSF